MSYTNESLWLTFEIIKDEISSDFTARCMQFPEASAQGRTRKEAIDLLVEILQLTNSDLSIFNKH